MSVETCCECEQETGRAGIHDDSLYFEDGSGPYCQECFPTNRLTKLANQAEVIVHSGLKDWCMNVCMEVINLKEHLESGSESSEYVGVPHMVIGSGLSAGIARCDYNTAVDMITRICDKPEEPFKFSFTQE